MAEDKNKQAEIDEKRAAERSRKVVDTGGGAYVGGDVSTGGGDFIGRDKVMGDKVRGDKFEGDKITIGDISGSTGIAIGRGASANITKTNIQARSSKVAQLFAPLQTVVSQTDPILIGKVTELESQVVAGAADNDDLVAELIADIAEGAPETSPHLVALFKNPSISSTTGPVTQFIIGRLG